MRIIIAGDGKVGYTLAEELSLTDHDVVIIDENEEALRRADEALDVLCIEGNAASAEVLREAGVEDSDLLLAVTSRDELNMICCLLGRRLGAKHTIARVRDPEYDSEKKLLVEALGLSMLINPELYAAQEIARMLRFPQANNIEVFAGGRIEMLDFRLREGDFPVGRRLAEITPTMQSRVLFCAVEHEGEVSIPNGDTVLHAGDLVYIIGQPASTSAFFRELGRAPAKIQNVMVIGGGLVTYYLGRVLAKSRIDVKVVELDRKKAKRLDNGLADTTVIVGDGTDQELLQDEDIEDMDAFISLTNRDEENLLSAIYAKDCGVPKVIAKINRENYTEIIRRMGLDSVITPKLLAANHILRYVRAVGNSEGSPIETLYRIVDGQAEALEFYTCDKSRLVGVPLRDLPLKKGVLVAALVRGRGSEIIIPDGDSVIESCDRVIVISRDLTVDDLDDLLERR